MSRLLLAASVTVVLSAVTGPALALSSKECSTKYQAAKQAGTLNGQKWNDFRKAECGVQPDKTTATVPNPMSPTPAQAASPAPTPVPMTQPAAKSAPAPMANGSAIFPKAINPKYASEPPGKGRMHTCLDQYNANKATGGGAGNGGMKWIEKGGGYYSACNKGLKG